MGLEPEAIVGTQGRIKHAVSLRLYFVMTIYFSIVSIFYKKRQTSDIIVSLITIESALF